ncbi:MAG: hypothetical protein LM591_00125 [Candidatus Korarchaeum sp.]|nr:hypothetical protein [Candidatus Korarchaeum sp.]
MERNERIKNLLMLRDLLKRRAEKLERELISLRRMIESLDEVLLEQTIVTADKLKEVRKNVEERKLYSDDGRLLGSLTLDRDRGEISFIPDDNILISSRERPVRSFLTRKIEELGGTMELEEDPKGTLKSLKVKFKDRRDVDRVINYIRWAFSKSIISQ